MRRHLKTLAGPLALFALLMFSGTAHANDIFTAPSTDWTMQYIFTPLFGQGLTFADSPLSGMMSIFNAAVLFIGGILAAYSIIAGTMSTAHDGEMLGKKWSSMWVPVRSALGTAAILPALNGFCVAQALILWLAMQGVGLADTLWTEYLKTFQQHAVYHNASLDAKLRPLFESMVLSNVCYESVVAEYNATLPEQQGATQYLAQTSNVAGSVGPTWFQNDATAFGGGSAGYNYGQTDGNGPDTSACGKVTLKLTSAASSSTSQTDAPLSAQALVNMPAVTGQIEQAHLAGLKAMQTAANAAALQFLRMSDGASLTPSAAQINTAINTGVAAYSSAVSAVAQQAFNSSVNQDMVSAMAQDGWASAGASYMRLMQAQSQVNAAVGNLPIGVDGTTAGTSHFLHLFDNRVDADVSRAKAVLADADRVNTGTVADGSTDGFSKIINAISGHNWSGPGAFDPAEDPIITASNLGEGMIDTAGWMGAAIAGGVAITAPVPLLGNITMALSSMFGPFIGAVMLMLVGSGSTLAYGEPMIPFITSVAVLISWSIMLLEAMVAAPLAAVMLLNPHQEAFGGLEKAMSLTLSVTLRPALAIFGIVGSIMLMSPIGHFINGLFNWAFSTTAAGGFPSLIKMLAGAVIYMGLIIFATKEVFKFMTVLPDSVLNWIGGGHGAVMGQAGETMKQGTSGAAAAGVGAAGALAATAGRGLGGARKGLDDAKKKWGELRQEREARASERKSDQFRADSNDTRTSNNAAAGDALKNALGGTRAPTDDPGTVSAARANANREGGDALRNALGGGSTGGNGQGQGTSGGTTGAKPDADGATPNEASTAGADRSTLRDPDEAHAEGGQGQGNDAASALRDALAQYTDSAESGTLKDAKNAGSTGGKEGSGTV